MRNEEHIPLSGEGRRAEPRRLAPWMRVAFPTLIGATVATAMFACDDGPTGPDPLDLKSL